MIIIVDRFVEGHLHVLANVNTLKILDLVFPKKPKVFVAEKTHMELVSKYFDSVVSEKITFSPYENKKYKDVGKIKQAFRVLSRLRNDIVYFYSLFKSVSKTPADLVFITHVYPLSLVFVKLIKRFFPKVKLIITIHGEIEYLFYGKTRYEKWIGKMYGLTFKIKTSNTLFLFLTKVSKQILIHSKRLTEEEILEIELPALPDTKSIINNYYNNNNSESIRIGHIGSAGLRKNTQFFYTLANNFIKEIESKQIVFSVIGPIEDNLTPYLNNNVQNFVNSKTNVHLDREIYNCETTKLDYSIFFYGENDFVLRSSAAFFDAIYFEKPLIVLKNQFFEEIFKVAGNIGYLCADSKEMELVIQKIIKEHNTAGSLYQSQLKNIKKYKETLNLNYIATDLASQMNNLNLLIK